jgi:hypothetical protein
LALPRKQLPARYAIFVAQLGRKFRRFSLTMQRYKKFKALPNYFSKKARKKARFRFSCKTTRKSGHFVIMSFVIKSFGYSQIPQLYINILIFIYSCKITSIGNP